MAERLALLKTALERGQLPSFLSSAFRRMLYDIMFILQIGFKNTKQHLLHIMGTEQKYFISPEDPSQHMVLKVKKHSFYHRQLLVTPPAVLQQMTIYILSSSLPLQNPVY